MFNFFHKKDDQILRDVRCELNWDPSVESADINVASRNGVVTLTGHVPHYYERYSAEKAAHRVGGVKFVHDKIEVSPTESYSRTDSQITDAARSALAWHYQVPDGITAEVDNGWVTLKGQVDWDYQRNSAEEAVTTLMGVWGVNNEISIKPKNVDATAVKTQIKDALKRSAAIEGRNVVVHVEGSKVTLSGILDSYAEIETARIAAWNAPGVMDVVNDLNLGQ